MILDDGVLAEMDTPNHLLLDEDGIFRGLWDKHEKAGHGNNNAAAH